MSKMIWVLASLILKPFLQPILLHGIFSVFLRLLEYARAAMPSAEKRGLVFPFSEPGGHSLFIESNFFLYC